MNKIIIFFLLITFSACTRGNYLDVQTYYLSRERLASYYVGTPDPMQVDPPVGQRLVVSWFLPKDLVCSDDLYLSIKVRLRNHQEILIVEAVNKSFGTHVYTVSDEDYCSSKGILTYKVDLIKSGEVIEEWNHQLWHELIQVGDSILLPPES